MTQKEMIEIIQQEFPQVGETQIRTMLNRAMDKFDSEVPGLLTSFADVSPIANKRRYDLSDFKIESGATDLVADDVLEITRVDYGTEGTGKQVKRILGHITDTDWDL